IFNFFSRCMYSEKQDLYEFGEFVLDPSERVLYKNGKTLDLPPRVFDTLLALVESNGRVISKDELMDRIWGDTVVEESNLTQNIYSLRQVFGKKNNFIKTVSRRGYKFTAETRRVAVDDRPASREMPEEHSSVPFAKRSLWRYRLGLGVGIAAAIFGVVGILAWQSRDRAPAAVLGESVVFERLTSSGDAFAPVISPDGRLMAYTRGQGDKRGLFLKDIESGNDVELRIENGLTPEFLQFMPDGSKLLFRPAGRIGGPQRLYEVSYFGGQATPVVEDVWGLFSVSPDGRHLAFYRDVPAKNEQYLILRDMSSGEEREIAKRILPDRFLNIIYPAWSADGKTIAFVPLKEQANRSEIVFVDVETGRERSLETNLTYIRQIAFLPDSRTILVVARDKVFQVFRYDYVSGETIRVTNDPNNYRHLSLSADGQRMVTQQRKLSSDIWLYPDADEGRGKPITEGGFHGLYDLVYTKTGDVVFDSKGKTNRDLRLVSPTTGAGHVLSRGENTNNNHWPETDHLGNVYFVSDQGGGLNIWRVKPDGTGPEQVTSGAEAANVAPAISPDGNWLYFIRKTKDDSSIWRLPLRTSGPPEKVFASAEFAPGQFASISPDGRWLAFRYERSASAVESPREGDSTMTSFGFLDLTDMRTVRAIEVEAGRKVIRWTNGGKTFDHNQNDDEEGRIWRVDLTDRTLPPKLVFRLPDTQIMHFAWSPDGRDIAITKGSSQSDVVMLELNQ
ncbi:MAG: winged helix-turn-helix domain-containing protein, partial [Pyrinomonadaceae bacterium]